MPGLKCDTHGQVIAHIGSNFPFLKIVDWIYHTFDNILETSDRFKKGLKDSCSREGVPKIISLW